MPPPAPPAVSPKAAERAFSITQLVGPDGKLRAGALSSSSGRQQVAGVVGGEGAAAAAAAAAAAGGAVAGVNAEAVAVAVTPAAAPDALSRLAAFNERAAEATRQKEQQAAVAAAAGAVAAAVEQLPGVSRLDAAIRRSRTSQIDIAVLREEEEEEAGGDESVESVRESGGGVGAAAVADDGDDDDDGALEVSRSALFAAAAETGLTDGEVKALWEQLCCSCPLILGERS